jgi:hypothetical protein
MTPRLALVLALPLAACGGGTKPVEPVGNTAPPAPTAGIPAAAYAGLFVDGATYRYRVESSSGHMDDTDPKADANGMVYEKSTTEMTCTVGNVTRLADRVAATLDCGDVPVQVPIADASPSGTYVATAAGLWRGHPDAELDPAEMLLAAEPAPRDDRQETPDGFGSATKVAQRADGAWCWDHAVWGGDDGGTTLCFAGGLLASGGAAFGGGSTHDVVYTLIR